MDINQVNYFKELLTDKRVLESANDSFITYITEYTGNYQGNGELILLPINTGEVSKILTFCNENIIPVTIRGAGTSLSASSISENKGIILSLEKLNKIIDIDTHNFQATVEPFVLNEHLANEVEKLGLFYPPDPASRGSCTIGGNVAHSSGGPRCVKYGTTKDYILNLEVVLPSGEIIWTGANTLKFSSGFNLTQLFVGSEGLLGVITKVVVKLIPFPKERLLLSIEFNDLKIATEMVNQVFLEGLTPSAIEFMDSKAIDFTCDYLNIKNPYSTNTKAVLLLEFDGNDINILNKDAELLYSIAEKYNPIEVKLAQSANEKEQLWKIRRTIGEAVRAVSIFVEEDTVVPRYYIPDIVDFVKEVERKYGVRAVIFGHAGDGNLHINFLKDKLSDNFWNNDLPKIIQSLFLKCKELGGTISGEHGIGKHQKRYLTALSEPSKMDILRGIKNVFDPNNILNKGNMFD